MMRRTHPHLWNSIMSISSDDGHGSCFWRAAGYVLDVPTAKLVIGIFKGSDDEQLASRVPFFHAWAEQNGFVIAPTTFERCGNQLVKMDRAGYYAVNGARDVRVMTRPHLQRVAKEIGLDRMLRGRQLRTKEPWGSRLLTELGYEFEIAEGGGVVAVQNKNAA